MAEPGARVGNYLVAYVIVNVILAFALTQASQLPHVRVLLLKLALKAHKEHKELSVASIRYQRLSGLRCCFQGIKFKSASHLTGGLRSSSENLSLTHISPTKRSRRIIQTVVLLSGKNDWRTSIGHCFTVGLSFDLISSTWLSQPVHICRLMGFRYSKVSILRSATRGESSKLPY